MSVGIIDRTDYQLLLALPLILRVCQSDDEVLINTTERNRNIVSRFRELNSRIVPIDDPRQVRGADVLIWLLNSAEFPESFTPSKTIFYPILKKEDLMRYRQALVRSGLKVPPGSEIVSGYVPGDIDSLMDFIRFVKSKHPLKGKKLLITGGPTAEDIDPVRFITNRSSGKMGVALARAGFIFGAEVKLVLGPASVAVPEYLDCIRVRSAKEMAEVVLNRFDESDIYIGAAAVADFTPARFNEQKIKKSGNGLELKLTRTTDILAALSGRKKHQILVGFSVETENEMENSKQKLKQKNLDFIIINNPKHKGAAFGQETNKVLVLDRSGNVLDLPLQSKLEIGLKIMNLLAEAER